MYISCGPGFPCGCPGAYPGALFSVVVWTSTRSPSRSDNNRSASRSHVCWFAGEWGYGQAWLVFIPNGRPANAAQNCRRAMLVGLRALQKGCKADLSGFSIAWLAIRGYKSTFLKPGVNQTCSPMEKHLFSKMVPIQVRCGPGKCRFRTNHRNKEWKERYLLKVYFCID